MEVFAGILLLQAFRTFMPRYQSLEEGKTYQIPKLHQDGSTTSIRSNYSSNQLMPITAFFSELSHGFQLIEKFQYPQLLGLPLANMMGAEFCALIEKSP